MKMKCLAPTSGLGCLRCRKSGRTCTVQANVESNGSRQQAHNDPLPVNGLAHTPGPESNSEGSHPLIQPLQSFPTIYNTSSANEQVHTENFEDRVIDDGTRESEPVSSWQTFEACLSRDKAIEFMNL